MRRSMAGESPGTPAPREHRPPPGGGVLGQHFTGFGPDLAQGNEEGQRCRQEEDKLEPLRPRERRSIYQQSGQPADDKQEDEEESESGRCMDDGAQIEIHSRGDEEDWDEEAVADGVQFVLQDLTSPGAQRRSTTPARNAPKTTSRPNAVAMSEEKEEHRDGPPQGGLCRCTLSFGQDLMRAVHPSLASG